jgi:hypothetical protein
MSDARIWIRSSYSPTGSGNNCVEVAYDPKVVWVRDSKNPATHIPVSPESWRAFLANVLRTPSRSMRGEGSSLMRQDQAA